MRILITGANGQLSKSLLPYLANDIVYKASKEDLDIVDRQKIETLIKTVQPEIIYHLASLTRGDECAKYPELAYNINVLGTCNVVDIARQLNIPVVFVSTNEVFNGTKGDYYTEDDTADPITEVGKNKLEAEIYIQKNLSKYFIIRTMWLYSENTSNFLHSIVKAARSGKNLTLVNDEIGSPTSSKDLAEAITKLVNTNQYGTYHLVNEGKASRLEFGKTILEYLNIKNISIQSVNLKDFNRLSKPPLFSALKNTKAARLGITLPEWKIALQAFLKNYEKS